MKGEDRLWLSHVIHSLSHTTWFFISFAFGLARNFSNAVTRKTDRALLCEKDAAMLPALADIVSVYLSEISNIMG